MQPKIGRFLCAGLMALLVAAETPAAAGPPVEDLQHRIYDIGENFHGDIGIAVKDVQTGKTVEFDGNTLFPQESVSKLWVTLTAFAAIDAGKLTLKAPVSVTRKDLTLFHQPIAASVLRKGTVHTTISKLLHCAIQQSDNTCNNTILRKVGGPLAVRRHLAKSGITGVRFGPGEKLMQSRAAGLDWHSSYSVGDAFFKARSKVPFQKRKAAFNGYIANPPDGAKPVAVVDTLARLKRGELLSAQSTRLLLSIMSHTRTGPQRLKGGIPAGWVLAHKTGTGQELGNEQTGYNDIGIISSPNGRSYAVAVMIRRTSAPIWSRMVTMQKVASAIVAYDAALHR